MAATAAAASSHADGSKHSSSTSSSSGSNFGGSGVDHLPSGSLISTGDATLSSKIDASTEASTSVQAGSEKSLGPSDSEIAAIKRRCAASILAVIPRQVARTFVGAPTPSNSDCTCSTAIGTLLSLTTSSSSSPPLSNEVSGGGPRSSSTGRRTSPLLNPSGQAHPGGPGERGGNVTADRPRTDDQKDQAEDDPEEDFLLRTIESDLLDLLGDAYCNKHLIFAILETVLARILPELSERSVEALMEDRGVAPVPSGF